MGRSDRSTSSRVGIRTDATLTLLLVAAMLPSAFFVARVYESSPEPGAAPPTASALHPASLQEPHPSPRTACNRCHRTANGGVAPPDHFLNQRATLDREVWADSARLELRCGSCHLTPHPEDLPTDRWGDAIITFMSKVMYYQDESAGFDHAPDGVSYPEWMQRTRSEWMDVLHYYFAFSGPERALPPDPAATSRRFHAEPIGRPPAAGELPQIGNVNVADVDGNGRPDVIVGDFQRHAVSLLRREGVEWTETDLAEIPFPGHTELGDFDGDGVTDIVVADVGSDVPTDDPVGSVVLLKGLGELRFEKTAILRDIGRVADVRPGDFDGDGDVDFVVAIFGFVKSGGIGWLERTGDSAYRFHQLSDRAGAVHVPPVDLDGDGRLDFIALVSQQHEEVVAFMNRGDGRFDERLLYKADTPTFGSSGIELTDLDLDGDIDILYTNGDAFDLSAPMVRPVHGIQWLENVGNLRFEYHELTRFYGAYRATAADFDGDGDLDIVATSLISDWSDPERQSIIWLENDGAQSFTPHGIANAPTAIITADVADLDGDGRPDIVTGCMHMSPSNPRRGRVALWTNTFP